MLFDVVAPKAQDDPALGFKFGIDFLITLDIAFNLRYPKLLVRFEVMFSFFPIIPMPKLAVTEHRYLLALEYNIGLSANGVDILTIAQPSRPKLFHQHYFDL